MAAIGVEGGEWLVWRAEGEDELGRTREMVCHRRAKATSIRLELATLG
jgi:hypothetical protein